MKKNVILILFCLPFFSNNIISSSQKTEKNDKEKKIKSTIDKICLNTIDATLTGTASALDLAFNAYYLLRQSPSYCTNPYLLEAMSCANSLFPHSVKLNNCEVTNSTVALLRLGLSTVLGIRAFYRVYKLKKDRSKLINLKINPPTIVINHYDISVQNQNQNEMEN
jgi:hypothetical protein